MRSLKSPVLSTSPRLGKCSNCLLRPIKGLCVVCGTQRRYHQGYQEIIKRVQDGMIGEPLSAQAYWNSSGYVGDPQQNRDELGYDTMEYQIRNWFSFIWTWRPYS
ncbi:MAG: hypothetical protein ACLUKN_04760 [Bacilli bacterium]